MHMESEYRYYIQSFQLAVLFPDLSKILENTALMRNIDISNALAPHCINHVNVKPEIVASPLLDEIQLVSDGQR